MATRMDRIENKNLPKTESGGPVSRCWKPPLPPPRPEKIYKIIGPTNVA
jgi:hypothetical protein